jgi:DNA-directed RNA polymerase specialized sigma24 family protein
MDRERQLEQAADIVLREAGAFSGQHPDCNSEITPARNLSRRRRRWAAEMSIEQICEEAGVQLEAPPPDVARLVSRALQANANRVSAHVWGLHELGLSQTNIARMFGVTQGAISGRISRTREQIRQHIDEHEQAYLVY